MLLHCAKQPVTTVRSDTGKRVTQYHPAFYHSYDYAKGKKLGVIRAHEDVMKRLGNDFLPGGIVGRVLPMLVPPRPWLAWDDGAYFYTQSRVVRTGDSREQEIYVRAASARGDLENVFEGLDVLGQTAWRINKNVFDVVLKVWNTGEEFADIPPAVSGLDYPPEPAPSADPSIRTKWMQEVREMKLQEKNNHSQRCDINFKVEIARAVSQSPVL
jgi:DNA-directed RNA polymerase